jgi:hypothetical protein
MATIKICDVCQSSKSVDTEYYATGTQPDVAGGSSETIGEYYDLCLQCENKVSQIYLKKLRKIQGIKLDIELLEIIDQLIKKNN